VHVSVEMKLAQIIIRDAIQKFQEFEELIETVHNRNLLLCIYNQIQ